MLKVMLVDDEILVRVGIKMMLDWNALGFDIVGEAANGIQALQAYEELKPDLIIIDMKMPQMDGPEFIKSLKHRNANTKIIILSCYDDFSYMKEALNYGAFDYLLKTEINRENLTETILRVKEKIHSELKKHKEYNELKKQAAWSNYIAQEKFWKDMLKGVYKSKEELKAFKSFCGLEADNCSYIVAAISLDGFDLASNAADANKLDTIGMSIYNIIHGVLGSKPEAALVRDDKPNNFIAVFKGSSDEAVISSVNLKSKNISQAIEAYTQMTVSIGVSQPAGNSCDLNKLYDQAMEALSRRIFEGKSSILFFSESEEENVGLSQYKSRITQSINMLSEGYAKDAAKMVEEALEEIFAIILRTKNLSLFKFVCVELIDNYNRWQNAITIDSGNSKSTRYLSLEDMLRYDTLQDIMVYYAGKLHYLMQLKHVHKGLKYSSTIKRALEYIKVNYAKDISLAEVARHAGISKSYLSVVFREETGQNFKDYLTDYRISMAKVLLKKDNCKIYEVSAAVGFENERYFSQVFRSREGMTPTEYRKLQ